MTNNNLQIMDKEKTRIYEHQCRLLDKQWQILRNFCMGPDNIESIIALLIDLKNINDDEIEAVSYFASKIREGKICKPKSSAEEIISDIKEVVGKLDSFK